MDFLAKLIMRRAGWVALIGTLLSIISAFYAVRLFGNLKTDIEELLPTNARSVIDLNEVTSRLESTENIDVLIFSEHPEASKRFVDDLADRLERFPRDTIAGVEYRIDRELNFFKQRRALYIDIEDLLRIKTYLRERIDYETELYNPLNIFNGKELPEPNLNFRALQAKYESKISSYSRFTDGYYATPDGKIRVLIANLPGKLSGIDGAHKLRDAIDQAVAELKPKSYAPDLEVKFTGGVQNLIEEQAALVADLALSTVIVTILVTLAMLLYYKSFRATAALVGSLFMGTFWTFGLSYFVVGYLNANSAFLGSIVIGNGINFGIIFLARYVEERRRGRSNLRAVRTAMKRTATSTWVAALAAALAYGSLMLTDFRGFNQFGVIGLIGMILCWISAFTLLPAFLTLMDRRSPFTKEAKAKKQQKAVFSSALSKVVEKYPRRLWYSSIALTIVACFFISRYDNRIIETDLSKLRDKTSMQKGSAYLSKYLDEVFQRYLSPIVILPKTREDTAEISRLLKEKQKREGKDSEISAVLSVDDFIPKDQEKKIKILREMEASLPPYIRKRMAPAQKAMVDEFLNPVAFRTFGMKDLPPLVLSKFRERDGTIGKMILIEPPLNQALWDSATLIQFIGDMRRTADGVRPHTAVAGQLPVTSDMFEAITRDGPRATLFAFLAVIVLVVLLFRDLRIIRLALLALLVGVTWMVGTILAFHWKINFLNFIAFPITFGIGVDYGVNIFQRYRQEGPGSIIRSLRFTGGAVALASLTTIIGYSSLLIAGNQAFVSFGRMAVLGEVTCLVAALVSLPAYLCYRDRKREKKELSA